MSITRKNIKEILPDIEDDALKSLLSLIHTEVDALKDANDDLQKQLKTAQDDTNAEKTAREKAEGALNDYKAEQGKKETQAKKESAYKALLKESGVADKFIGLIMKATDMSGFELGEDGKFKNAEKLTESIKSEHADFISKAKQSGTGADNPPAASGSKNYKDKAEILAIKNTSERQQAIAENHELFGF